MEWVEKIRILVAVPLEQEDIDKICGVDPRVEVFYAMEEVRAEQGVDTSRLLAIKENYVRQPELTPDEAAKALDRILPEIDVIFAYRLPLNVLERASKLKWAQSLGSGVDLFAGMTGILDSPVKVTNARGINATMVAEFAMCLMLMLIKQAPQFMTNKLKRRWKPFAAGGLNGKTVGIVGLGMIGTKLARLSRSFGMRVFAAKKRMTDRDDVDRLFPASELVQMLSQCDLAVLSLPLSMETKGLIGESELKAIGHKGYLINVARGPIVQQDVLIQALKEGWIAGAALDVFDTEPLSPQSELWDLPNVIISPHNAGRHQDHTRAVSDLFCENLKCFLLGEEMKNVVHEK